LDYETSLILGYLLAHDDLITALEFLSPHPLLLSTSIDAKVCIWTVRPVPIAQRYICIQQFINKTLSFQNDDVQASINAC
jgi:WD40 repeat protein